jgi:cobalt-zinc-cadmium efflux system outer membrane protein
MKNITIYIAFIVLTFTINAQTELDEYLKIGAKNNPELKSKFASYHATLQQIPQVGTLPDPQLSFGYFISPIETRNGPQQAKLGVNQLFPWFGTLHTKEDVVIQRAKANYEIFEDAKSKLFFEIKSTYYNVYFAQKGIETTEENIKILKTFQNLAIIKIETGKGSIVDEMRVEMEINELENKLAYLKDSKWALEVEINELLNDSISHSIKIPKVLWNDSLAYSKESLLDTITSQNHLIKQIEHRILSWKHAEISGKKVGSPQISLGLDYYFVGKSNNPDGAVNNGRDALMAKFGLSIPLYRKKYNAIVNEAVFQIQATEYEKESKKNQLTILFEKNYRDYLDANRRIDLYTRQLQLANKSLEVLLTAYSSDGQDFEEVLRMERKVLEFTLALHNARTDNNAAVAFITYLTGS